MAHRLTLNRTVLDVGQVSASELVPVKAGYEIHVFRIPGSFAVSILFSAGASALTGAIAAPSGAGVIPFGVENAGGAPWFVCPSGSNFNVTTGTSGNGKGALYWSYVPVSQDASGE